MRISVWSSDVCSSDPREGPFRARRYLQHRRLPAAGQRHPGDAEAALGTQARHLAAETFDEKGLRVAGAVSRRQIECEPGRVGNADFLADQDRKSTRLNSSH